MEHSPTSKGSQKVPLDPSLSIRLAASIKGTLHSGLDPSFEVYSRIFNGDVIVQSSLLVRPFDAEDISQIVQFCVQHGWSFSVKAGGYGTHGQAVQGNVIIDISLLNDIHIEPINEQGTFTRLRDMPSSKNAGKLRQPGDQHFSIDNPSHPMSKRSAAEAFGRYILASRLQSNVPDASSASGSNSALTDGDSMHPNTRRKVWPTARTVFGPPSGSFGGLPSNTLLPTDAAPLGKVASERNNDESSSPSSSGKDFATGQGLGSSFPSSGMSSNTSATSLGFHKDPSEQAVPSNSDPKDFATGQGLGSSFPSSGMSSNTSATSLGFHKDPSEQAVPSNSDPFGYMAPEKVSGPQSQSFLPPVPPSFSVDLFSVSGSYTPRRAIPSAPHAYITFGAGAKQKDIDLYSASHPLPATAFTGEPCFTPYHVPFSAHPVGSSVMLLGGFGFLSRLHGLSIDNLVEAEVVLADGSIVTASEEENSDLFWALRGAGPALGIVTRYKTKAYPVPVVFAGNLLYKFRKSTAASLIKHFRDCIKNVPRELYANVILTAGPDGDALLVIQICYLGTQEQGIEYLQAITSWDGEQCLLNEVSEKNFLTQQDSLAQLIRGKAGRKWFIRSILLNSLSDQTIHETVMRFANTPTGCTWLFELTGGNVSDEHGGCFPATGRQAAWTVTAFHQWELDEDDPRCVTAAVEWMDESLGPESAGGPYPCFFGIHETSERIVRTFGDNWTRLCELKRKYDPSGLFKHTFWPLDEHGQPRSVLVSTHTEF